ncbi:MAG: DarT ssDNA thymidine ADP-ribosyltransferase family protein [Actinomycetota bacterium]
MPDECIHGFQAGLCDTCFPKPVPVAVAASTTTTTRSRTTTTSRSTVSSRADHKVGEQRIYHVTHIDNLPFIIDAGAVLADQSPAVDISSAETRDARRDTPIGDGVVADFVPFFLSPNATVWEALRSGRADPRLSPEVRDIPAGEFVILVSTVKVASTMEVAVADGDAANTFTRFTAAADTNDRALRTLRANDDAILGAELLVKGLFPFEQVSLIGVANDRARDAVKQVLQAAAHEPKVAVYPPWFGR